MLRTIYGDDERFKQAYWSENPGVYFTGDGARKTRTATSTWSVAWMTCSTCPVNRIGTARDREARSCRTRPWRRPAAVGRPDDLKGQALVVFVTLKPPHSASPEMKKALSEQRGQRNW